MNKVAVWKNCEDKPDPEGCTKKGRESVIKWKNKNPDYDATRRSERKKSRLCRECGAVLLDTVYVRCPQCLAKHNQYYKSNTGRGKHREETWRRRGIVDMTIQLYDTMLASQNGLCYLCGEAPRSNRSLAVDHNHLTRKPRKLLCDICNTALERLENHEGWEVKARAYLKEFAEVSSSITGKEEGPNGQADTTR